MLTKKDIDQIDELFQRRLEKDVKEIIKSAFQDFYNNIFEPYANKNEKEHAQIVKEMKAVKMIYMI